MGAWSNTDGGLRARLLIGPSRLVHGTPVARVDLELDNVSDVGTPMLIRWDERALLQFTLQHPDGSEVATGPRSGSVKRPQPYDIRLPYQSSLRLHLSVSGWSIAADQRVHIALPNRASWTVPASETRPLELAVTLEASAQAAIDAGQPRAWRGKLVVPTVVVE